MLPTTFKTRHLSLQPNSPLSIKRVFDEHWPAYKTWYTHKLPDAANPQQLRKAELALKSTLPELLPVYHQLREISNDCPIAANFLTGYQPPAYLVNCSQAILNKPNPVLIRNYDLSPALSENLISHTDWLGQSIIGTNECLWGLDDGMNQAGLATSLTFGGSKQVGKGFGIPFIMRYILQTCETVRQAIKVLQRIPSHMAYNVTLIDKSGDFATIMLAPNQAAIVTRERCITNHQQRITWPEQAAFSKTLERKQFLDQLLEQPNTELSTLRDGFLEKPLHSTNYSQQFGTVFTATYQPTKGTMAYHWPGEQPLTQGFTDFKEEERVINLGAKANINAQPSSIQQIPSAQNEYLAYNDHGETQENAEVIPANMREILLTGLEYLPATSIVENQQLIDLQDKLRHKKPLSWQQYGRGLATLWTAQAA